MVEEQLKEIIHTHLYGLKRTPSGWQKSNCPVCVHKGHAPDKRERFGVLYSADGAIAFNCFNCGFSTAWHPGTMIGKNLVFLLSSIGVPQQDIDKLKFESFREQNNVVNKNFTLRGNITKKWVPIDMSEELPDCYPIRFWLENDCEDKDFLQVVNYAADRNVLDIDRMYWSPTKEFLFNKRFTIPFTYRNEIVGWTGRITTNAPNVPKYYHKMPPSYIYGLDHQQDYDRKYHIITEGVLDAIVTDGVAVLHNDLNEEQAALISKLHGEKVLLPDRDKSGDDLVEIAIEHKWSVAFPNWGKDQHGNIIKDAAQAAQVYGHLLTMQSIVESIESDKHSIRVKRKLDKGNYGY
jgi:hypothetical protein